MEIVVGESNLSRVRNFHDSITKRCVRSVIRLRLHGAIYRSYSYVLMLRYCANLKAIRYESTSLNRIVADKSHRVIVALVLSSHINRFDDTFVPKNSKQIVVGQITRSKIQIRRHTIHFTVLSQLFFLV